MTIKIKPTTSKWIRVEGSGIHGKGIFAACDISKGEKIIEYVGRKITKDESGVVADEQFELGESGVEGHVYIFELNDKYDLDGNVPWNTARLINHTCDPNCESENDGGRVWIIALRDIKKGEELGYDYGYTLEGFHDHPCKCGSVDCVGYIVRRGSWWALRKRLAAIIS